MDEKSVYNRLVFSFMFNNSSPFCPSPLAKGRGRGFFERSFAPLKLSL
jgi:hypothetical protein